MSLRNSLDNNLLNVNNNNGKIQSNAHLALVHLLWSCRKEWAIPEKIQTGGGGGGGGYIWNHPCNFSFSYFTPGTSRQNKDQPLDIPQSCVRSFGNSKAKNKDPWKFHIIFSWSSLEILLPTFLINPCKFHMLFLWNPWKFHILNPPSLDFFWNSPIAISLEGRHLASVNSIG